MLSFIKLSYTHCRCGMKDNILNFALSPLCLVYMKFLMPKVIKLGCKRCIGWKRYVKIFLLSVEMSCLPFFCCAMRFLIPSVIKLGCKRCIGWKQYVKIFLLSVKMSFLRFFCCAMKFFMPSVIKLGCKRCIG